MNESSGLSENLDYFANLITRINALDNESKDIYISLVELLDALYFDTMHACIESSQSSSSEYIHLCYGNASEISSILSFLERMPSWASGGS
ncbi:MAG: hypothetical protein LBC41_17270 [Clostridiales bacterium]|nr:hypothetical protein [Clostridiales bacterium]